jgi:FkbH-like protein
MAADVTNYIPLYARLSDRFGDHGLISVVVAKPEDDQLVITDWLMSCRVLARGVEQYLMNRIFAEAEQRGLRRVTGEYIPSAKNAMVRDFFTRFGFELTSEEANGHTTWALDVAQYEPKTVHITAVVAETAVA